MLNREDDHQTDAEMTQLLELADHNSKVAVPTMLHEVRDYMFVTNEKIRNLSREINSIFKKLNGINFMKINLKRQCLK